MSKGIRLIGRIILIFGISLFVISQVMETTVATNYANIDTEVAINLPKKVPNIELIANKINLTLLGGFLIVIGLQLLLVQTIHIRN